MVTRNSAPQTPTPSGRPGPATVKLRDETDPLGDDGQPRPEHNNDYQPGDTDMALDRTDRRLERTLNGQRR